MLRSRTVPHRVTDPWPLSLPLDLFLNYYKIMPPFAFGLCPTFKSIYICRVRHWSRTICFDMKHNIHWNSWSPFTIYQLKIQIMSRTGEILISVRTIWPAFMIRQSLYLGRWNKDQSTNYRANFLQPRSFCSYERCKEVTSWKPLQSFRGVGQLTYFPSYVQEMSSSTRIFEIKLVPKSATS